MNKRKAKKKYKKELRISRWPAVDLPPRYVRAFVLDVREAIGEQLDYAILFGASLQPPKHFNRHIESLIKGTKLREKNTTASLLSEMQGRPVSKDILGFIGRSVHAE